MLTKICKKCGKELPITEFGNNPMSKDGHINTCKMFCKNILRYSPSNTEEKSIETQNKESEC